MGDGSDEVGESKTETTRIDGRGRVTIPKRLRAECCLVEGDELHWRWETTKDGIKIVKVAPSPGPKAGQLGESLFWAFWR